MEPYQRSTSGSGHGSSRSISTTNSNSENIQEFNKWCDEPQGDEEKWRREKRIVTTEERFGSTWDFVVVPGMVSEAVSMSDTAYGAFVNFGNIFNSCFHYVMPTNCRCPKQIIGMICSKCKISFCDEDCLKMQVENNGILSPEAKEVLRRNPTQKIQLPTNSATNSKTYNGPPKKFNSSQQNGERKGQSSQLQAKTTAVVTNGRRPYGSDQPGRNSNSGFKNNTPKPVAQAQITVNFGNSRNVPGQYRGQHSKAEVVSGKISFNERPAQIGEPKKFERILRAPNDFTSNSHKTEDEIPSNANKDKLSSAPSATSSPVSAGTPNQTNTIIARGKSEIATEREKLKAMESRTADVPLRPTIAAVASPYSQSKEITSRASEVVTISGRRAIDLQYEAPVSTTIEMGCFYVESPSLMGLCAPKGAYIQKDLDKQFGTGSRQGLQQLQVFAIGGYALTQFEDYTQLYRAKILEVHEDSVKVYYLDFGNTGIRKKNELMKLPDDLLNLQTCTSLYGISSVIPLGETEWSVDAIAFVKKFEEKTVRCNIEYIEKWHEAGIYKHIGTIKILKSNRWKDLGEILIAKGWARRRTAEEIQSKIKDMSWKPYKAVDCSVALPPQLTIGKKVDATICHVNHLQDFYVTLMEEKREREQISGELNRLMGRKNVVDPYNPSKGNICAALIDDRWQRVEVLLIKKDLSVEVLQIDTGKVIEHGLRVDLLKEIPDDLKSHSGFAYHCKLPILPQTSSEWGPQLIKNLKDLQKSSTDCLQIKCFHIENEIHVVELYESRSSPGWSQALITVGDAQGDVNTDSKRDAESMASHAVNSASPRRQSPRHESTKSSKNNATNSPLKEVAVFPQGSVSGIKESQAIAQNSRECTDDLLQSEVSSRKVTKNDLTSTNRKHLPVLPNLAELQAEGEVFTVSSTDFCNVVFCVPRVFQNQRSKIKVAIDDLMDQLRLNPDIIKDFNPRENDVVCVSVNHNDNVFFRGVIESLHIQQSSATVSLLDYGIIEMIPMSNLRPVNQQLMMFPPTGYLIKIESELKKKAQVMPRNWSRFEEKLRSTPFVLSTVVGLLPDMPAGESAYVADLQVVDNDQTLLSQMMSNLIKMQWELLFDAGYKTPDSIMSRGEWSVKTQADFYNSEEDLALNKPMSAKVLKVFRLEDTVHIILLKEDMRTDFKQLTSKFKLYYNKVHRGDEPATTSSIDSPQFVGVRLNNQLSQVSKIFDTQWQRGIKCGKQIQSVDDYTEWKTDQVQIAEIRELCPEFLEMPSICFHAIIPDIERTENVTKAIETIFAVGKEVKFLLTDVDKQEGEKSMYTLKSPALEKLMTVLKGEQM